MYLPETFEPMHKVPGINPEWDSTCVVQNSFVTALHGSTWKVEPTDLLDFLDLCSGLRTNWLSFVCLVKKAHHYDVPAV